MQRLADSLIRNRGWWMAGTLTVLVIALALASRLSLRHEMTDFQPRGVMPDTSGLSVSGGADRVVILLESDQAIPVAKAGPVIDSIASRLERIPGIRRIDSRLEATLQRFLDTEAPRRLLLYFPSPVLEDIAFRISREGIERGLLHSGDSAGRSDLADAIGAARTDPLGLMGPVTGIIRPAGGDTHVRIVDGYFAVPDRRIYFLTAEPDRSLAGIDRARIMVAAIERALDEVRHDSALADMLTGIRIFAVGRPVAYVQGFAIAVGDAKRVSVGSGLTVLLLLLIFLRRPLAPLMIIGTVMYGLVLTGAVAFLIFGSVSLVGWLFISVMVGLGDEFALYIVSHYWVTGYTAGSRADALASALRRPGPGILLGGLTSAGAFVSLIAVSYPVMVQLGWITAVGLVLLLGCSFTVLPLALSFTRPHHVAESAWFRFSGLARMAVHWPRWSVLPWALLIGVSLWFALRVPFEPHPWKVAMRGHPAPAELDRVQRRLGASFTPILMVSRGRTEAEALSRDRAATAMMDRIRHQAGVTATVSLSRWLPSPEQQQANIRFIHQRPELFSPERFRRDFLATVDSMEHRDSSLVTRYLPQVAQLISPDPVPLSVDRLRSLGLGELIDRHLVRQGDEYLALSLVYLTRFPWAEGALDKFMTAVRELGGAPLGDVRFLGDAVRGATHTATLKRDIRRATALALGLVGLVLVGRFRRPSLIALCLLPLVCGISASLGLMGMLGIELNILTLAIAPLLIGLGVDDGIHMVDRLARGESAAQVLRETAPAMTITTLTTIAGFACLGLATFRGVRELGLVAAFGLIVCLVASLHLVPLGYQLLTRRPAATVSPGP
jgi:predicted exporter